MLGTGNDIVALGAINVERTRQTNFYSKILSPSEQQLYTALQPHQPFENFVWLAWSVKESAYKFLQKFMPDLVFSPTRITLTRLESGFDFENTAVYKGTAQFKNETLYFRCIINHDYIFSVVNFKDDFTHTQWGVKRIDSAHHTHQSSEVRELLLCDLNDLQPGNNFTINKSPHGWPIIIKDDQEISLPVSLAHHGHYVAYSFQLK